MGNLPKNDFYEVAFFVLWCRTVLFGVFLFAFFGFIFVEYLLMSGVIEWIVGEYSRKLDERYRLTLPSEFEDVFKPESGKCVIAKERPGCLSLWEEGTWRAKLDERVNLVQAKLRLGDLEQKMPELQRFGRILSTRHRELQLAGRSRVLLPEGFREFLAVEPGKEVMVIGASVCIEIWHPQKWLNYVEEEISEFRTLLDSLSH
ncbi:MAG: division/cell wall cluster transcriptional repressor MraZ [Planctomycetaceae bacterium]|nr:division/cell wall cluster transcriptional repressor MraZ [Planctomycetaceae bacterium]